MANRLTIKGQVTIPKEVRDFLGLTSGDSLVEFHIAADGTVCLTKAASREKTAQPQAKTAARGGRAGFDILSLLSGVCA